MFLLPSLPVDANSNERLAHRHPAAAALSRSDVRLSCRAPRKPPWKLTSICTSLANTTAALPGSHELGPPRRGHSGRQCWIQLGGALLGQREAHEAWNGVSSDPTGGFELAKQLIDAPR